jgi:hypothetical protein
VAHGLPAAEFAAKNSSPKTTAKNCFSENTRTKDNSAKQDYHSRKTFCDNYNFPLFLMSAPDGDFRQLFQRLSGKSRKDIRRDSEKNGAKDKAKTKGKTKAKDSRTKRDFFVTSCPDFSVFFPCNALESTARLQNKQNFLKDIFKTE